MHACSILRRSLVAPLALAALLGVAAPVRGEEVDCNNPPPPDASKNFLQNFLSPCYVVNLYMGSPDGDNMTDLDQTYAGFFYRVNPKYELILIGEYPRGRYFSITADDGHHSTSATIHDSDVSPIVPHHVNPFTPGVTHKEDQLYAVTMQFGGKQPDTITPGCDFGGLALHANVLDASRRHEGISWNGKPDAGPELPPHEDFGPNTGGLVTMRQYLSQPDGGALQLVTPVVIARDLSTGCAAPAPKVVAPSYEELTPDHVITFDDRVAYTWVSPEQFAAHKAYRSRQVPKCYGFVPASVLWFRPEEYVEFPNPDAGYILGVLDEDHVAWLVANKGFLRIRLRLPSLPNIPCDGCSMTGAEEARYYSMSFYDRQKHTLASLGDFEMVKDPNGYVTLIIGFGSPPPEHVTPENYYTYFDLAPIPGYADLIWLGLRMIVSSPTFRCSPREVPFYSTVDNSLGGFMGEYAPVVDVLTADLIPPVAEPLERPDSCGLIPPEPPGPCSF